MKSAILMMNPKFPHNVGQAVRACAAFGCDDLLYTGDRLMRELRGKWGNRLPREERMKGYKRVNWRRSDNPFGEIPGLVPVAIEVRENSEMLNTFEHPRNALYVFGPEDGSLTGVTLRHCHHFVAIPSAHCLNLSMAIGLVLYDRQTKLDPGKRMTVADNERRGWYEHDDDELRAGAREEA